MWDAKWAAAFCARIEELTGSKRFVYAIAVTRLRGDASAWSEDATIRSRLGGNPVRFLRLEDMWSTIVTETAKTPASSEIGRLAQVLKAAGVVEGER